MNDFLRESKNPQTSMIAWFEDDSLCAWLYLCDPETEQIIADAFLYNRIQPIAAASVQEYRGGPPPIAIPFASSDAQVNPKNVDELCFVWAPDGKSVALTYSGNPLAMILAGRKRGLSKAVLKTGPWGEPWNQRLFDLVFQL